ncbi:hypothetical protein DXX93_08915 [Thalassotalea euphylliae]|uniref:Uncharacterized protein n=1 Tax=Thalassotalea euphylliae TaxID=1655234 RepID=A0A3E0TQG5_9GAMM|nr:hypothetical protein [Thalassotalea euphylliae]REL26683.1 hypothetical protein DXX93_08915 [Thalassotalea euphylliae]
MMKYLLISILLLAWSFCVQSEEVFPWIMGKYSVQLKQPCTIQVQVNESLQEINNVFGKNIDCSIANLSQTNIPNAFVIGGGHILIIEKKINIGETCRRVSKALYLPNVGEAVISKKEVKSGNCDGHIEGNSAMYLVSPHLK